MHTNIRDFLLYQIHKKPKLSTLIKYFTFVQSRIDKTNCQFVYVLYTYVKQKCANKMHTTYRRLK